MGGLRFVDTSSEANREYFRALGRALAGAIIFSLPLLMTMEMWSLGFYLDRTKLVLFIAINFLVLVGLSRVSGFEPSVNWFDDTLDAFSAYGVAVLASIIVLALFGIITLEMPAREIIGKVAIQTVPGSFGAMLASKQLAVEPADDAEEDPKKEEARSSYVGELFLMLAGALFLGFNVAPTEEMVLISYQMTGWHGIALVLVSIILLHAFVYAVGFEGTEQAGPGTAFLSTFLRFSIVGYGIALLVSLYVLWTFGRTQGVSAPQIAAMVAVLGFPSAIGAAIARLVV